MKVRMSLLSRLTYLPLVALAFANVALVLGFWSTFGDANPLIYQIIGCGLALIEFTALVVVSDASARGEKSKALVWRGILLLVLLVNLAADFGAVVTMTAADSTRRRQAIAAYDAAVVAEREADAEVVRLTALLEERGMNRPAAALEAEQRAARARREAYVRAGAPAPRRVTERVAAAESAYQTARALEARTAQRVRSRAALAAIGARPAASHSQFTGMAELLAMIGVRASAEQVRVLLAALVALILKLVLVFGFWALTPRLRAAEPLPGASENMGEVAGLRPESARAFPSAPERPRPRPVDTLHRALDDLERGDG